MGFPRLSDPARNIPDWLLSNGTSVLCMPIAHFMRPPNPLKYQAAIQFSRSHLHRPTSTMYASIQADHRLDENITEHPQ